MKTLRNATEEELLKELLSRREVHPAPDVVHLVDPGYKSAIIGIGSDNYAQLYLTDDDIAALDKIGDVVSIGGVTTGDVPVDDVLSGAIGKLSEAVVVGYKDDGIYLATSQGGIAEMLLLIEMAKHQIMNSMES